VEFLSKAPKKYPFKQISVQPSSFEQQWQTPYQSNQSTRLKLESIFAQSTGKENMPHPRFMQEQPLSQILSQNEAYLSQTCEPYYGKPMPTVAGSQSSEASSVCANLFGKAQGAFDFNQLLQD
jgi:hypothetical protein